MFDLAVINMQRANELLTVDVPKGKKSSKRKFDHLIKYLPKQTCAADHNLCNRDDYLIRIDYLNVLSF